ncbi:GDP-mannose 4,6-dehydratase [Candidatus Sumerlaeota bacterium]|nr:GDP-mannose 4,6-dehydratase [Candidatus Sumerlaeota bacterium]
MKIVLTGAGGFVGPHLMRELCAVGHHVIAIDRTAIPEIPGGSVTGVRLDLNDRLALYDLFAAERPDAVIHAAGWSHVGKSWENPSSVFESNVINTIWLYQTACEFLPKDGVFLYISSADILGPVSPGQLPITEKHEPNPRSPYAVSKHSAEMILRVLESNGGARVIVARPFNHIGPGQSPGFVCPSFARQIAEIEAGRRDFLMHGNLTTRRDFLDVRDVARAYRMLLEQKPADPLFIIASGESHSIQSIVEMMFTIAGMTPRMKADPALFRPADISEFRGSPALLQNRTGWRPEIPLQQSLRDLLDDARAHLQLAKS